MGAVMIKCPVTGNPIPTGVAAEREAFARTPVFMARCYCRHCLTEHEWFAQDAWVEEARAEPRYEAA
jgi:hypothetical protein